MRFTMATGRMLFFIGASLFFIGIGLCMTDQALFGVIMMSSGAVLILIGFTILRLHIMSEFYMARKKQK